MVGHEKLICFTLSDLNIVKYVIISKNYKTTSNFSIFVLTTLIKPYRIVAVSFIWKETHVYNKNLEL